MTNMQKPTPNEESPSATPDTVGSRQLRTRDKIFKRIGGTVDLALDTGEFMAETTGYSLARIGHVVSNVRKAIDKGSKGEAYRHAA